MKLAICDDDPAQRDYLNTLVQQWAEARQLSAVRLSFASAEAFQFAWDNDKTFDAVLLDVQMEKMNGLALARAIRKEDQRLAIIFISGYDEYIGNGYEVAALHYLLKPVKRAQLFTTLDRAVEAAADKRSTVMIESSGTHERLFQEEIIYAEAQAHQLDVHTTSGLHVLRSGLDTFEKQLDTALFCRIHRSYLVGLRFIAQIRKDKLKLDNNVELPISRRRLSAVNQAFIRFFHGGMDQ